MKVNHPYHSIIALNGKFILLAGLLLCINLITKAEIYTTKKNGNYDQKEIWFPFYPGNIIKENDTVVISAVVVYNIDVVVKGTLLVKETGSLTGKQNLIIVKSGTLLNFGTSHFAILTNRGAIYNQHRLEVSLDFVNSGNVINHMSIEVGNLLDNTGLITGKSGEFSANRKFINSRTGIIKGYVDVCSNNFLNVEGGTVDTQTTTFCGNPIFNNQGMAANQSDALHFQKSVFAVSLTTGQYTPF